MDENSCNKSRRELRRESRLPKNKKKFDSWVQHQKSWKVKKSTFNLNSEKVWKLEEDENPERKGEISLGQSNKDIEDSDKEPQMQEKSEGKLRDLKRKNGLIKGSKTKFNEYLELEIMEGTLTAKEDLKLERKLAKKLKIKNGKLQESDDDIDMLFEGIPYILSNLEENGEGNKRSFENGASHRKCKTSKLADIESNGEKLVDEVEEESDTLYAISDELDDVEEVVLHKDSNKSNRKKTKFKEYLETEMLGSVISGEADLALGEKLAKKLKVKQGKLGGEDDNINMFFSEIPSVLDSIEDELVASDEDPKTTFDNSYSVERHKKRMSNDQEKIAEGTIDSFFGVSKPVKPSDAEDESEKVCDVVPGKYVTPHLRSWAKIESEEYAEIHRQIRGHLNRLSESNLESIIGEISTILKFVGRIVGSKLFMKRSWHHVLGVLGGNKQYAAVFSAFVAGMACFVGIDFGAKLLACLAKRFEEEYLEEDNLSLQNLTLFLSYLYIFGVCSSELVYDFLKMLSKRLTEADVSTVLTVLQILAGQKSILQVPAAETACGVKLRGDDPVEMKNFISSIESRVNEMKASSGDGQSIINSKRMDFMLYTIYDIKDNKKRPKESVVQHTRIKKWLHEVVSA